MSRSKSALATAALASFLIGPVHAAAQESTTRGFTLGLHFQGASLVVEDGDRNTGGGLGLQAGYGINRIVTLMLTIDGAEVDVDDTDSDLSGNWGMAHVDLGARFHFANSLRSLVPYLEAAVGARAVGVSDARADGAAVDDVSFTGGSFTIGGGLDIYLKEALALEIGVKWTGGEFNKIDLGSVSVSGLDIDAKSTRFSLGLNWWP